MNHKLIHCTLLLALCLPVLGAQSREPSEVQAESKSRHIMKREDFEASWNKAAESKSLYDKVFDRSQCDNRLPILGNHVTLEGDKTGTIYRWWQYYTARKLDKTPIAVTYLQAPPADQTPKGFDVDILEPYGTVYYEVDCVLSTGERTSSGRKRFGVPKKEELPLVTSP
jgi:hypothetical protein